MNTKLFTYIIIVCLAFQFSSLFGQTTSPDTVKCFAQCRLPFRYRFDTIKVVDKPVHKTMVKVPGSFLVMQDTIEYSSGDSLIRNVPAVYDVYEEKVLVSSSKNSPKYKNVTKYIVLEEARTEHLHNVTKYKPVTIYEQFEPSKTKKIEVPATYTYVVTKTLISGKPQMVETEIICSDKVTVKLIKQVQEHLRMMGYEVDNLSKELGDKTIESLEKFQQENQLPVGELNIPTLQSLNILP